MIRLSIVALLLSLGGQAFAEVSITDPWIRLLPPSAKTTAGYLTIQSDQQDKLLRAETSAADRVELHSHTMVDGMMSMMQIDSIDLSPDGPSELKPSGNHLMFFGLVEPLKEGQLIELQLQFEKAGSVTVQAPVRRN